MALGSVMSYEVKSKQSQEHSLGTGDKERRELGKEEGRWKRRGGSFSEEPCQNTLGSMGSFKFTLNMTCLSASFVS